MAGIGINIDLFSCWYEAGLRQSIERATTMPCDTTGADRISLDSCVFQSSLPSML